MAPGRAPIDAVANVARLAAARIEAGALNDGGSLECLARELGLSSRQLRPAVRREFGVTAVELAQTRRLLLAKQLLAETSLPVTQVAYAAGFESVRRFNALFRTHYRLAPSALRRAADTASHRHSLRLTLAYRPPCAWPAMTRFLAARATPGVEQVVDGAYSRTVSIGAKRGWLRVEPLAGRHALAVVIDAQLTGVLPELLARLRRLFDLDARPDVIAEQLRTAPLVGPFVDRAPDCACPAPSIRSSWPCGRSSVRSSRSSRPRRWPGD